MGIGDYLVWATAALQAAAGLAYMAAGDGPRSTLFLCIAVANFVTPYIGR